MQWLKQGATIGVLVSSKCRCRRAAAQGPCQLAWMPTGPAQDLHGVEPRSGSGHTFIPVARPSKYPTLRGVRGICVVCLVSAATVAVTGCGDARGMPIVLGQGGVGGVGGSTGGLDLHGDPSGGGGDTSSGVSGGLCSPCRDASDCGGRNDYCLFNGGTNESFCGIDCLEQSGCPDGYACMSLGNLIQCAPISGSCDNPFTNQTGFVSLNDLRPIVLDKINSERARNGVPALAMTDCLTSVAQSAAVDFSATGTMSGKFDSDCKPLIPNCACGWESDNQSHETGNGTWTDLVTWSAGHILNASNAPTTVLSDRYSRVGVGIVVGQGEAWVSVDLAP